MSKAADAILRAYHEGESDKKAGRPRRNPYGLNKRDKRTAYNNGYNSARS